MKIQKLIVQFGLFLGCFLALNNCSASPSQSDAEQSLRQQIDSESGGQIKLVSFNKTDGQEFEVIGVQGYNMDYEAEIEFQADGTWFKGVQGIGFGFSTQQATPGSMAAFENQTVGGGQNVHRGDRIKIAGVMQGEKKESGWKFELGDSHIVSSIAAPATVAIAPAPAAVAATPPVAQNVSSVSGNKLDFPPEAEQFLRRQFESELGAKVVSFQNVNGEIQGIKLNAAAEVEFENDMTTKGGVTVHQGDRADYTAEMVGVKRNGVWRFMFSNMDVTNASNPLLFSQLQTVMQTQKNEERTVEMQNACINNLRQIDGAINEWALENGKATGAMPTMADIKPYIKLNADGEIPGCPAGGTYTLHPVGSHLQVTCSIPGHALPQ
jgi:hypothetical protein